MDIHTKLPGVGTTIFTIMSALASKHGAINLGQGFPDFDPDPLLLDEVHAAMKEGHNQYPPMPGIASLREAISSKVKSLYGRHYDSDSEITVTAGASEGLMATIMALVHPGDEVIVIEPFYDLYNPVITLCGARPVIVPMLAPDAAHESYRVDWQRVQDAVTAETRALIVNFPHNPTGITLTESDLDALEEITANTDIVLISDEVYEHVVLDGKPHLSLSQRPSLASRSVIVSSFGKTYHVTGWKIGYCCAPAAITAEIRKVHQFNVFTVVTPMQYALARYMSDPSRHLSLGEFYQTKHDRLFDGLSAMRFKPIRSSGTFFLLADYREITDMPEAEFSQWLTVEHGVGVIPMSAFYRDPSSTNANHGLVRFCFAKKEATLDAAIDRLKQL